MKIYSFVLLLYSLILLSGCTNINDNEFDRSLASDNYRFLQKEYENLSPRIEFHLLKNKEQEKEVLSKVFGNNWKKIAGFTYWNETKGTCRIFIRDPEWIYQPEIIGHEVSHCIWGRFHKGKIGQGPIVDQWKK